MKIYPYLKRYQQRLELALQKWAKKQETVFCEKTLVCIG
jgi:hypothetical protein